LKECRVSEETFGSTRLERDKGDEEGTKGRDQPESKI
jgi:hypothetical protein